MREFHSFTMKRLLVAMDFSNGSYGALHYARELARSFSAKVLLVHVIDDGSTASGGEGRKGSLSDRLELAEVELQRMAASFYYDNLDCTIIARAGAVPETIRDIVEERDVDLLVVGTEGRSGKDGETLGSIAESLLRISPCPVLTVGVNTRSNAYKSIYRHRVLFPTDFSDVSLTALPYAECLAKHLAGDLLIVHVDDNENEALRNIQASFNALALQLKHPEVKKEFIPRTGQPADSVVDFAVQSHVDFIVMATHRPEARGLVRNYGFAFDVICRAKCPVFTLLTPPEAKLEEESEGNKLHIRFGT